MLGLVWSLLWALAWSVVLTLCAAALGFVALLVYDVKFWFEQRKKKQSTSASVFVEKGKVRKVCVIGAGPSGIAAAKEVMAGGMEVVVFEQTGEIGGTWVFREKEGQSSVYRSTFINTSKQFMTYSDFPMSEALPTYPHHKQIIKYFRDYAKHFEVTPRIRFHTQVVEVQQKGPAEWLVKSRECADGKPLYLQTAEEKAKGNIIEETYDAVLICSGHHTTPRMPKLPGQSLFKGQIIHSHAYKDPTNPIDCNDKRVVVVGIGNSGVDISNELSRCARQVYLSVRTGAWVLPKFIGGRPMDHVLSPGRLLSFLVPPTLIAKPFVTRLLFESQLEKAMGHPRDYLGVEPPGPLSAHPSISHELYHRIGNGTIVARRGIKELTETEAVFEDGSRAKADIIIFSTGYHISFPFLPDNIMKIQPLGAIMPISELQARWVVQVLRGAVGLPTAAEMKAEIQAKRDELARRYVDRPRHTIQVDWPAYPDEIAEQIGAKPDLLANLKLAAPLLLGPTLPPHYRLNGIGKWDKAAEETRNLYRQVRNHRPTMEAGAGWDD